MNSPQIPMIFSQKLHNLFIFNFVSLKDGEIVFIIRRRAKKLVLNFARDNNFPVWSRLKLVCDDDNDDDFRKFVEILIL